MKISAYETYRTEKKNVKMFENFRIIELIVLDIKLLLAKNYHVLS